MMITTKKHSALTAFTVVGAITALAGGGNMWVSLPMAPHLVEAAEPTAYTPNITVVKNLILTEINRLRAQNHLPALKLNNTITLAWSNGIVAKNA